MKIRTRMAGAVAGTATAGLAVFAVGAATPAGAQQVQLAKPATTSVATHHTTIRQDCGWWNDYCGWYGDDWYGGWYGDWGW